MIAEKPLYVNIGAQYTLFVADEICVKTKWNNYTYLYLITSKDKYSCSLPPP